MALPSIITSATDGYVGEPLSPDKDPDSIKLFVGQVPKNFKEKDLKPYLDPYGPIHELIILRDKLDMSHKGEEPSSVQRLLNFPSVCLGCAFVTYCSKTCAELAQEELHDKLVLPGVSDDSMSPYTVSSSL